MSAPDTPELCSESPGAGREQHGLFPGRPRGEGAGRENGHPASLRNFGSLRSPPRGAARWTPGRTPGLAWTRATAQTTRGSRANSKRPSPLRRRPYKTPPLPPPPTPSLPGDSASGDPAVHLPAGRRLSPASAALPACTAPSSRPPRRPALSPDPAHHSRPSRALPRRPRAAGSSARCSCESPGRTRSPRRARRAGERLRGRRGWASSSARPHPTVPTPPRSSFLHGGARARAGTRSEVGGRRRVAGCVPGAREVRAEQLSASRAVLARGAHHPVSPVAEPPPPRVCRAGSLGPAAEPARSGLRETPPGKRNAPTPWPLPWPSAGAAG